MQKIDLIRIYQRKAALVIDDYTDMRGSIRRMLGNLGLASIDVAGSGEEALRKCETQPFDIILADYNLGEGKNGQQLLEELRYRGLLRHTSLYVMITAETTRAMVFGALEYQPDDYLTKPFTQPQLQHRLDRLMMEKEALRPVNIALDNRDWREAMDRCDQLIASQDRFAGRALRMKAMCHEKLQEFAAAQAIYQAVQKQRPLEWAQIGLGKCLLARDELDAASVIFQELIDNGCLCLEVYDCLAEIKSRQGDIATAQQLLEHASDISPNAILRQQALAAISQDNGDWERAEKAHRRVVRLGAGSCYESPENYLRMARCVAARIRAGGDPRKLKEIEAVVDRVRRRYRHDDAVQQQSELVLATARAGAGLADSAGATIAELDAELMSAAEPPAAAMVLDLARAWQAVDQGARARALLVDLAARHPEDSALLEEIDRVSDEPLSDRGKARASQLNSEGRDLFAAEHYGDADRLFSEALRLYPNNIALKLNLLLALVKRMNASGYDAEQADRARILVRSLDQLSDSHPLFQRLSVLKNHLLRLQAAA